MVANALTLPLRAEIYWPPHDWAGLGLTDHQSTEQGAMALQAASLRD